MKKNLLALMFVIAFICIGVSVASAKTSSSPRNSVAVSKRLSPAKIKDFKAKCMACESELLDLQIANWLYEVNCAAGGYQSTCNPAGAQVLIAAGNDFEECLYWSGALNSKNIDKTMDWKRKQRPNV